MPYAPNIVTQNIAPQLMMQGAQATAQGYANLGKGLGQGIESYFKAEEERAKKVGAARQLMKNPFVVDRISKDQPLWELGEKIESGKANLNVVNEFLSSATVIKNEGDELEKRAREKQQQQLAELQMKVLQDQMARNQFLQRQDEQKAAQQAEAEARFNQNAGMLGQLNAGVGGGVLRADTQNRLRNNQFLQARTELRDAGFTNATADQVMDYASKQAEIRARAATKTGGYSTQKEALDAARASGAKNVSVQQTGDGRWIVQASFTDPNARTDTPEVKTADGRDFIRRGDNWIPLKKENAPMEVKEWRAARVATMNPKLADQTYGKTYGEYRAMHEKDMNSAAQPSTAAIPTIRTKAEYDALPPGPYIGPDGKRATKR